MNTLKVILEQDHAKRTKQELSDMLKAVENVITPEVYTQISGVKPEDLPKYSKAEILDVIEDFNTNYDPSWEANMAKMQDSFLQFASDLSKMVQKDEQFSVQAANDADFAAELGSIDFENLISGPLNACVTAQTKASMATVDFIKRVGMKGNADDKELVMVNFKCEKPQLNPNFGKTAGEDGVPDDANVTDEYLDPAKVHVEVPLISIINIPTLRIETCDIDFNVKLNSVYTRDVSSELGIDTSASAGWGPVKFKVSAAYKRSSSTGVKVEKEYSMAVKVKATNDERPQGLEDVLAILSA